VQFHLPLTLNGNLGERHYRRGENQQNRRDDDQLDEGEAAIRAGAEYTPTRIAASLRTGFWHGVVST
jgi:hypothetical protein